MTQEKIELLLKDLSSRLPYGVKVVIEFSKDKYTKVYDLREIDNDATSELRQYVTIWDYGFYSSVISYPLIDCKPCLRPMSSMTEEEKKELYKLLLDIERLSFADIIYNGKDTISPAYDYLLKNHFDYRGLIPMGLAIEAPEGIYNSKT